MTGTESHDVTIPDLIKRAGGATAIQRGSRGEVSAAAVYKWPKIGIPDRHWPLIISLTGATADELLSANQIARATPSMNGAGS